MPKYSKFLMLFCALFFVSYANLHAAGLSTGFSEVTLEDLEIGKAYSTKEVALLPLVVVNTGEESVDLKVEVLQSQVPELKEGYMPLPALSWIKLEKADFLNIKPNETAITDIIVSIPNDEKYLGKQYQVFIWSHTTGTKIGVGLKSKLLLKIVKDKYNKTGKLK